MAIITTSTLTAVAQGRALDYTRHNVVVPVNSGDDLILTAVAQGQALNSIKPNMGLPIYNSDHFSLIPVAKGQALNSIKHNMVLPVDLGGKPRAPLFTAWSYPEDTVKSKKQNIYLPVPRYNPSNQRKYINWSNNYYRGR